MYFALLLIANFGIWGCQAECLLPWVQPAHDSPCYMVSLDKMSQPEAYEFCAIQGGSLAEPRSSTQTEYINSFINPDYHYWIGLSDLVQEGHFVWESDGTTVEYSNWYEGEPNSHGNEDCVILYASFGMQWADDDCPGNTCSGIPTHVLCQKSP